VRVTHTPTKVEGPPQWVRHGTALAFDTASADFRRSAVLVVADSGGPVHQLGVVEGAVSLLTRTDKVLYSVGGGRANRLYELEFATGTKRPLTDSSFAVQQMVYSPDGSRIAYVRSAQGIGQLVVMRADGTGARAVVDVPTAEGRMERPAWSPDGASLAYQVGTVITQTRRVVGTHIWVVDIATGTTMKLAEHGEEISDGAAAWSPDGRDLAFMSNRSGRREVWMMSRNGRDLRQITR
jgi:Tol biopolymer transport system component